MARLTLDPLPAGVGPVAPSAARGGFADDADLAELIALFVADLSGLAREIELALAAEDRDQLGECCRRVHVAARGYGFTTVSRAARRVTELVDGGDCSEVLRESVGELVTRMRQIATVDGA